MDHIHDYNTFYDSEFFSTYRNKAHKRIMLLFLGGRSKIVSIKILKEMICELIGEKWLIIWYSQMFSEISHIKLNTKVSYCHIILIKFIKHQLFLPAQRIQQSIITHILSKDALKRHLKFYLIRDTLPEKFTPVSLSKKKNWFILFPVPLGDTMVNIIT